MNGNRALRGALYGCGMISEFHLKGWKRIPEVEIVAIGNRTVERAQARAAHFYPEARVYSRLDDLLTHERLDFIDILTTPELHYEHCTAARDAGLHVICQKPLAESLEHSRELVAAMSRADRLFVVHENHRLRPWFQDILARDFGPIRFLRIEHFNATLPGEAYKTSSDTGVWLEYGSHLVDMMRRLLGEPAGVHARQHHLCPEVRGETLFHATFHYPGATAVIDAGWKQAALTQGSLLVVGERGEAWYEGTLTRGASGRYRVTRGSEIVLDEPRNPLADYEESFYLLERRFTDAVLHAGPMEHTGEENLRTLEATFAAYAAAGRT